MKESVKIAFIEQHNCSVKIFKDSEEQYKLEIVTKEGIENYTVFQVALIADLSL